MMGNLERHLVIDVKSSFVGSVRPAFHVIDEGPQLRHHLTTAGIVEKHTGRHRCECLQDTDEFSRLHRSGGDWLRHLRKPHIFDGGSQHGGKVVGDQRPGDNSFDRLLPLTNDHGAIEPFERRMRMQAC